MFLGPGLQPNAWVIFPEDGKISETNQHAQLTARPGAEYLVFFSSRFLKTRERYISFAQLVLLSLYIF